MFVQLAPRRGAPRARFVSARFVSARFVSARFVSARFVSARFVSARFVSALLGCALLACAKPALLPVAAEPRSLIPASAILYGIVDLKGLAENKLLAHHALSGLRDHLLGRLGLRTTDAQKLTGTAQVFALSPRVLAAFLPGVTPPAAGRKALRMVRGIELYAGPAAGEVGAAVPGGVLLGHEAAVVAALDVLRAGAPAQNGTALEELVERGAQFRTVRLATQSPGDFFAIFPQKSPPAALTSALRGWATYATLEDSRLELRMVADAKDEATARGLANWLRDNLQRTRAQVAKWRESAGLLGGPLVPALAALDAIRIKNRGAQAVFTLEHDLEPLVSGGLLSMLKTLRLLGK